MTGKIILTILQIIFLVGAVMFLLGAWDITGFSIVDDPMGDGINLWNFLIASTLFWIAIFLFLAGVAFGKKDYEVEENYEFDGDGDKENWKDDSKESKKIKKFKSKKRSEENEKEW